MQNRSIYSAWNRVGLSVRLSIAMSIAMLIGATVLLSSYILLEKSHSSEMLAAQLVDDMNLLLTTLPEQVVIGDYATIEKILKSKVESKNITTIVFSDSYDKKISIQDKPAVTIAPHWFVSLCNMPPFSKKEEIIIGGRKYGFVEIHLTTTPSIDRMWSMLIRSIQVLLLALVLATIMTSLIVRRSLRPLVELAAGARRIGSGDYSSRIPEQGIAEIAMTITAFNQMAQELTQSHNDLNRSRDSLQEQYEKLQINEEMLRVQINEYEITQMELKQYQDQLKSFASEIALTQERERRQIAVDVHDYVVQDLAFARIKLNLMQRGADSEDLKMVIDIVDGTIGKLRHLLFDLSSTALYEIGLTAALETLGERLGMDYGFSFSLSVLQEPVPTIENTKITIYQIVRELLLNAAKHSQADRVNVMLSQDSHMIRVIVEDNGCGFDVNTKAQEAATNFNFGLFSIRQRLNYLGGMFAIYSKDEGGTHVEFAVPNLSAPACAGDVQP